MFAQSKFTGNQALVITYSEPLTTKQMLKITQEFNFKETSFVSMEPNENGAFELRIFTPIKEVSFSGHLILATAYVINHFLLTSQKKQIKLKLHDNLVTIESANLPKSEKSNFISKYKPVFLSEQEKPDFGKTYDRVLLSRILNLEVEEIDKEYPIQEMLIGIGFILIPIKNLKAIRRIFINEERYNWLVQKTQAKALLAFCPEVENKENDMHIRVFASYYNIPEDSASGSGSGCLAAYLAHYNYYNSKEINIKIEQGIELGRPSQIIVKTIPTDKGFNITIGGQISLVGKGEIYL